MTLLRSEATVIADAYDRGSDAYVKSWPQPHVWLDEERNRFASSLTAGASILDVGCGPGHDSAYFRSKGFKTLGIDVSAEMIRRAELLYPDCKFSIMNALDVAQLGVSFDAVWLAYVILHIPKDKMPLLVEAVHSCLKDGGLLFFVTSVDATTVEEETDIAGLKDAIGMPITVYTVRWQINELRALFSGAFRELWAKTDTPLPNKRSVLSSLWRRR